MINFKFAKNPECPICKEKNIVFYQQDKEFETIQFSCGYKSEYTISSVTEIEFCPKDPDQYKIITPFKLSLGNLEAKYEDIDIFIRECDEKYVIKINIILCGHRKELIFYAPNVYRAQIKALKVIEELNLNTKKFISYCNLNSFT